MHRDVSLSVLHAFVLECLDRAPIGKRIVLLRTLAEVIGSSSEGEVLLHMAHELEQLEAKHQQLLLDFRVHSAGSSLRSESYGRQSSIASRQP